MKLKKSFLTYIISIGCLLGGCLLGGLFIRFQSSSVIEITRAEIFLGFGLTFLLGAILLISGKFFFDRLKPMSIRAWRGCIFSYFIFVLLIAPKLGDSLIVARDGWLSLYKHPFVWLILATLLGNIILYFFKSKNTPNIV